MKIRQLSARAWLCFVITVFSILVSAGLENSNGADGNQPRLFGKPAQVDPLTASPSWSLIGNLNEARQAHTMTLLQNGKVLAAGGVGDDTLASSELWTGVWNATGALLTGRFAHTATLLANGKVLVVGGISNTGTLRSAELYDPATGTWAGTGDLQTARHTHTATLLPNGKVLVVGGFGSTPVLASCQLYDPATGTWTDTGSLNTPRGSHTATLLPSGKVLVAGGVHNSQGVLGKSELYDPAAGTWANTGDLVTRRQYHTATLLPNGKVLATGGLGIGDIPERQFLAFSELYDPASGTWTDTGLLSNARHDHTATLLPAGKVLVAGGSGASSVVAMTEMYDPAAGTWAAAGALNTARFRHAAALLANGKVLVAGGDTNTNPGTIASSEYGVFGGNVPPGSLTVTKTADTNDGICDAADCSLREALAVAGSDGLPDTIVFNIPANSAGCVGTDCTITLTSSLFPAADAGQLTTINGYSGPNTITLSGNNAVRILNVANGANIKVNSVNFTSGNSTSGAAILNTGGTLTLTNSALFGNTNPNSQGGALRCETGCVLNLTNVTISGNSSAGVGGGIFNSGGTVTATNCTIANNNGGFGGGGISNSGTFNIRNTIIAGNTAAIQNGVDASGTFASQGHNLLGKSDGATGFTATGDQTGTVAAPLDPQLGALANNGGPTRTHALQSDSPAINAGGNTSAPAHDQRYLLRNGTSDIGAYEDNGLTANVGISSIARLPTGQVILLGLGLANTPHTIQVSANLTSGFTDLGTATSNATGAMQYDDDGAVGATSRFYRLTFP